MSNPTAKQTAFIRTLIAERDLTPADMLAVEAARDLARRGALTPVWASVLIDRLVKAPRKVSASATTTPAAPEVTEGATYRLSDGRVVRIVKARETGRLYGKVWDEDAATWLYMAGALRIVRNLSPITLAEAEEFGKVTHHCAICGRRLTKAVSIARGIGPVCADRIG